MVIGATITLRRWAFISAGIVGPAFGVPAFRHGVAVLSAGSSSVGRRYDDANPVQEMPLRPAAAMNLRRAAVREAQVRFRAANLRVFGSALHGTDKDGSDLDLLVDALPGATLFDLRALQIELEELLGVPVDLLTPQDLPAKFRHQVLAAAQPV